jgi:hypothetical protein
VHFYQKYDDLTKSKIQKEFTKLAEDMSGIVFMGAVSCDDESAICEKEGVTAYPTVRIYPKTPIPTMNFGADDYNIDEIKKAALRTIDGKMIEINQNNIETFLKDNPTKPKVLLFTDKPKGSPIAYKAITEAFEKTIIFGIVRSSEENLIKKYKVTKYPNLQLFKASQKTVVFTEEFKYQAIHDFLNVYSEIFVFKGEEDAPVNAASKPWLSEPLPELRKESSNDLCYKSDSVCVVLALNQAPTEEQVTLMKNVAASMVSNLEDRGAQFKFMWINLSIEDAFKTQFEVNSTPSFVILRAPTKKLLIHDEKEISEGALKKLLDKMSGGDGRFKRL